MTGTFAQQQERPSRTARAAAAHRAAHQQIDGGRVFHDPLALAILGDDAQDAIASLGDGPGVLRMRRFIAARTRLAEEALHAGIEQGVTQLVVLGAGLDTYALRGAQRDALTCIFELDHPGTQAWKRRRLAEAGIPIPAKLRFVPINFEKEQLPGVLAAASFDASAPTFFTWMGVVPYLTQDAISATLAFIGGLADARVVFDYTEGPDALDATARSLHELHAARVAAAGEPWISYFDPPSLHRMLRVCGFARINDFGPREIVNQFFPEHAARAPTRGGHVLHAANR